MTSPERMLTKRGSGNPVPFDAATADPRPTATASAVATARTERKRGFIGSRAPGLLTGQTHDVNAPIPGGQDRQDGSIAVKNALSQQQQRPAPQRPP